MTKILRIKDGHLSREFSDPLVAALGSFDGIHIGHQEVLKNVAQSAERSRLSSALITFVPHPSVALGKAESIPLITTLRQRLSILSSLGIGSLVLVTFTKKLSLLESEEFIDQYLCHLLNVRHLVLGPDARVGKDGKGTAQVIQASMEKRGRSVEIIKFTTTLSGIKIGSRAIREAVAGGQPDEALSMLGRYFEIQGRVVRGDGRGHTIGVPTANVYTHRQVIPQSGVYAGWAKIENEQYVAVANVGIQPTFNGTKKRIEVHLLDFPSRSIYGKNLSLTIIKKIREEKKFDSIESLKSQIALDIESTREIVGQFKK